MLAKAARPSGSPPIPTRAAILEYHTGATGTLVFLVRRGADAPSVFEARMDAPDRALTQDDLERCARRLIVDFHGLPQGWDSRQDADEYRDVLRLPPAVNAAKRSKDVNEINLAKPAFSYRMDYWDQLSDALFPPALRRELEHVDLLCLIPHGPLHGLPFAALRWSKDEYLIDRFGLCIAPSATVLRYCQIRQTRAGDRTTGLAPPSTALIAAVAAADDQDPSQFEEDGRALAEVFRTSGRRTSVEALVGAGGSDGVEPASRSRVMADVAGRDVVHIACHGIFGIDGKTGDPMDSGLVVSDGTTIPKLVDIAGMSPVDRARFFISATDVLGLDLDASLVSLRACSSGRALVRPGDELVGLTRAFLYAGAASMLVSLWNVNIRSSKALLDRFYEAWIGGEEGTPKWQALRTAQTEVRAMPGYEHPYHWAPFVLAGDWR